MVFLFILPVLAASKFCYKYQCGDDSKFPSNDTCIHYEDDIFYVRPCANATDYCAPADHPSHAPTTCIALNPSTYQGYPGDPCTDNSSCISATCTRGKCVGTLEGANCSTSSQCDPGLYCMEGTCQKQLPAGSTNCTSIFDCVNTAMCNTTTGSDTGNCVELFSVEEGTVVSDCADNFSYMCESGSCVNEGFLTGNDGHCTQAFKSQTYPQECTEDTECSAKVGNTYYENTCECGYTSAGTAYCKPFPGDAPGINLISQFKAFMNSGNWDDCNTERRFFFDCYQNNGWSDAKKVEFMQTYIQYQIGAKLINLEPCVEQVYANQYWKLGSAMTLVAILGAFMF